MQNEFEKQVRRKMEDLDLFPTDPVWKNIQEQIRKKKDRKRMLFWFPLAALLAGAGIWGVSRLNEPGPVSTIETHKQTPVVSVEDNRDIVNNKSVTERTQTPSEGPVRSENVPVDQTTVVVNDKKVQVKTVSKVTRRENDPKERESQRLPQPQKNEITIPSEKDPAVSGAEKITDPVDPPAQKQVADQPVTENKKFPVTDSVNNSKEIKPGVLPVDKAITDTLSRKKIAQATNSKWELGLNAGIGVSSLARGLNFLEKSFAQDFASSPQTGSGSSVGSLRPSEESKGIAYSVGIGLRKQLSEQFAIITGAGYSHYSTHVQVGQTVIRDTLVVSNQNQVRLSEYYRNSATGLSDYQNHYHFISVPVGFEYRPGKNVPLSLHAGFSVQKLVGTNALVFNSAGQFYHEDKNAIRKTQLFADIGAGYLFRIESTTVSVGPQIQFGLSKHLANGSNRHLVTAGLNTQIFFNKKNN